MNQAAYSTPIDQRGYVGSERNRVLSPADVVWARAEHAAGRVTAPQLARMWGMGVESIRRMLRGDTYTNVGQTPTHTPPQEAPVADGGAFERLVAEQQRLLEEQGTRSPATDEGGATASEAEAAIDAFLKGDTGGSDPFGLN